MKTDQSFGRRNFLKSSVLGATGVVAGGIAVSQAKSIKGNLAEDKIIYRTLGKTGINLPIVSMGVMRADNPNLVKAALKTGVIMLDTAYVYQGGNNETMLGKLLKDYPRESFVIATKIKGDGMNELPDDEAEEAVIKKFNTSMERLQLDYVDILYLHSANSKEYTLYKPFTNALKKLKKEGRTRFIGVSTHSHEPEVIDAAAESGFYDVVLTAINYTQDHRSEILKSAKKASEGGMGIVAMKTMAGGFLDKERTKKVNAKAALKWVMQNDFIHTSIPGYTSFDQLDESWSVATDLAMTDEEKNELNMSFNQGSMYCNACEQCVGSCPKGLPIPEAMRAYMYAYGYKETIKAKELITRINLDADACTDCETCSVQCVKNFDVRGKIASIREIKGVPDEFLA
jgi:uncharacterized protein